MNDSDFLSDYNSHAIAALCDYLEIEGSKLVRSSQFNLQNNATDLLIDITKAVGAVRYLLWRGCSRISRGRKVSAARDSIDIPEFLSPNLYASE